MNNLGSYLPVAEGIAGSERALTQCMEEHTHDKLVTEDCASVLSTLTALADRFHTQYEQTGSTHSMRYAMRDIDFDTGATLKAMQEASSVLDDVASFDYVPLPSGTSDLSLKGKRKFRQAQIANGLFCDFLDLSGPIVDRETEIRAYIERLRAIESGDRADSEDTDLERWAALNTLAKGTVELVTALASGQGKARGLMAQMGEGDEVTPEDIEEAEADRDILAIKIRRPRVSAEKRASLTEEHRLLCEEIAAMHTRLQSQSDTTSILRPYLLFPEVAKALGVPLRERKVDTGRDQHPMDWGEGMVVSGEGLVEGQRNTAQYEAKLERLEAERVEAERLVAEKAYAEKYRGQARFEKSSVATATQVFGPQRGMGQCPKWGGDRASNVTLILPSVQGSKTWVVHSHEGKGIHMYQETTGRILVWCGGKDCNITRSGTQVSFVGHTSFSYPCTPGQEVRIPLSVDSCNPQRNPYLTLSPQE
ncbi:hypothetical protein KIPB_007188 [Kipferlia bialata]|uniref:Uncharacterized protein n=1 Tax=Kipferlia bialata TaxID=797122 RepID=A0A9K3GJS4_9EUKA|nr:hypothetical protein KIPB_007188 [Kipferlia bialata]|eukprot:g7188.t1